MTPRQARLGVDLFTGTMVVSVAIALAGLTWRLAGDPGTGIMAAPVVSSLPAADIAPIVSLAPFGTPAGSAPTGAGNALQLRAIFLATPIEASSALIAIDGGAAKPFRIGENVNGAVIEKMTRDYVELRTSDGLRSLAFPRAGEVAPAAVAAQVAVGGPKPAAASGVDAIRALIPESVRGTGPSAATAVRPAPPVPASPPTGGYRIGQDSLPAIFAAGLRPGDVIERINGTALGDSDQDRLLVMRAMSAGSAQVEIVREGRRMSLSVPVRQGAW